MTTSFELPPPADLPVSSVLQVQLITAAMMAPPHRARVQSKPTVALWSEARRPDSEVFAEFAHPPRPDAVNAVADFPGAEAVMQEEKPTASSNEPTAATDEPVTLSPIHVQRVSSQASALNAPIDASNRTSEVILWSEPRRPEHEIISQFAVRAEAPETRSTDSGDAGTADSAHTEAVEPEPEQPARDTSWPESWKPEEEIVSRLEPPEVVAKETSVFEAAIEQMPFQDDRFLDPIKPTSPIEPVPPVEEPAFRQDSPTIVSTRVRKVTARNSKTAKQQSAKRKPDRKPVATSRVQATSDAPPVQTKLEKAEAKAADRVCRKPRKLDAKPAASTGKKAKASGPKQVVRTRAAAEPVRPPASAVSVGQQTAKPASEAKTARSQTAEHEKAVQRPAVASQNVRTKAAPGAEIADTQKAIRNSSAVVTESASNAKTTSASQTSGNKRSVCKSSVAVANPGRKAKAASAKSVGTALTNNKKSSRKPVPATPKPAPKAEIASAKTTEAEAPRPQSVNNKKAGRKPVADVAKPAQAKVAPKAKAAKPKQQKTTRKTANAKIKRRASAPKPAQPAPEVQQAAPEPTPTLDTNQASDAASVADLYGLHIESVGDSDRGKLLFFDSVARAKEGDWQGSDDRLKAALDSLEDDPQTLIWKQAIEQSLKINRKLDRPAA